MEQTHTALHGVLIGGPQKWLTLNDEEHHAPADRLSRSWVENQLNEIEQKYLKKIEASKFQFGKNLIQNHTFQIDPIWTFLNHGSYGASLTINSEYRRELLTLLEKNTVVFSEHFVPCGVKRACKAIASFVGADKEDIVMVQSATAAVSTVLRSLSFSSKDVILLLNFNYAALKKLTYEVCRATGAKVIYCEVSDVLDDPQALMKRIYSVLTPNVKFALIDHIISETGTTLPVNIIVPALRERGIKVMVDGAHVIGQIPLKISEFKPDFYCSNMHKWLCGEKGTAFLYVAKERQQDIHPLIISHGYSFGFQSEFLFTSTNDYTAFMTIPLTVAFWNLIGPEKIMARNHELVIAAGKKCCAAWGTKFLYSEKVYGTLATIEIPDMGVPPSGDLAVTIRGLLRDKHHIESFVGFTNKKVIIRLSAAMYNDMDDFDTLIATILRIQKDLKNKARL